MTNLEIALILKEIAKFLELKEENPYRVRAYNRGADIIEKYHEDIVRLVQENRLKSINGIGEKLASQVEEIIFTGRCRVLEELKGEFPPVLRSILGISGVGVKTARTIFNNLEVKSLNELKIASEEGRIKELPGLGKKTEEKILEGIEKLEKQQKRSLFGLALPFANSLVESLKKVDGVIKVNIAGSIRRKQETVEDIDIALMTEEKENVKKQITNLPLVRQILAEDDDKVSFLNVIGLKVDVFLFSKEEYCVGLLNLTGNEPHVQELKEFALNKGYEISWEQVKKKENNSEFVYIEKEADIYELLGLQYIPPELRESDRELELAKKQKLPSLIKQVDLRGDLHLHTNWSDGGDSIEDMIQAALDMGYEYIAVTDHSASLKIARGLSERKVKKQKERIKELNKKFGDKIAVLSGIEVDILNDGTLDYSDDLLKELDFVVASIHQGFGMDRKSVTNRVIKAMKNPYVNVIGHPIGRLINKREGHDLDLERIYKRAEETSTAIEINSSVDRLDLPYYHIINAKRYDVKFVINTDAHDTRRLHEIKHGVFVARKGYLEKEHVLNTYSLNALLEWLAKKVGGGSIE